MKKILSLVIICLVASLVSPASAITKAKESKLEETLNYDVYYHWGFIWKKAGSGVLSLADEKANDGTSRKHGKLCGRTLNFVESLMKVRDTLECWYNPETITPIEYCKLTHEGSYNATERNYYRTVGDSTRCDIYRWRSKKGNDRKSVATYGEAYDMLTIFYKVRSLDFENMKPGQKFKYYIVAGIKGKWMNATYLGKSTCTLRSGKEYPAYRLEFTFESKDSDSTPLQVWLSREPDHRPLSVVIQLKRIGSIQGEIVE